MLDVIFLLGMAAGLYVLWKVARPDLLRIAKGTRRVRATVVRHLFQDGDGYVPVFAFSDGTARREVRGFAVSSTPDPAVGASVMLVYPQGYPQLARRPQPFQSGIFYTAAIAWVALCYELLSGNLL